MFLLTFILLLLCLLMSGFLSEFLNKIIKFFSKKKPDWQIKRLQQMDFKHNLVLIIYKQEEYLVLTSSCGNPLLLNKFSQVKPTENKPSKKSV